jgi:protein gp37
VGQTSSIEWTDSTWNPATGCTRVSPGCDNCYAAELAARWLKKPYLRRLPVVDSDENRADPFAVRLWPERLEDPRRWAEPRMIFVNSMSDLFHVDVPDQFVRAVFKVMLDVDRHVYQVLTKRPSRARRFVEKNADLFERGQVPPHIWMGTSVEDQRASHRVGQLRQVRAAIRFLSCEPLLGPLRLDLTGIGWVIAGGESGPRHRVLNIAHVQNLRDQCVAAAVPFFFKQVGGRTPKAGGRLLDGRTWEEFPQTRRARP